MAGLQDIGTPTVVNRGFLPLAIEAGIEAVIKSLIGLGLNKRQLLIRLAAALETTNPDLVEALNMDTLDAILRYMSSQADSSVMLASDLPNLLNEAGPVNVAAARDGTTNTQVNVTFSAPAEGYTYQLYLDGVFVKAGSLAASEDFVNETISDVASGSVTHSVRVLFVAADGSTTKFGPIAQFS